MSPPYTSDCLREADRRLAALRTDPSFPGLHPLLPGGDLPRAGSFNHQGQASRAHDGPEE